VGYRQLPQGTTRWGERKAACPRNHDTHRLAHTHRHTTDRNRQTGTARAVAHSALLLFLPLCDCLRSPAHLHLGLAPWPHPLHWHTLTHPESAHHLDVLGHSFPLSPCVCPLALKPAILLPHRPRYALTHSHAHAHKHTLNENARPIPSPRPHPTDTHREIHAHMVNTQAHTQTRAHTLARTYSFLLSLSRRGLGVDHRRWLCLLASLLILGLVLLTRPLGSRLHRSGRWVQYQLAHLLQRRIQRLLRFT
jgi:hypothetical protein